MLRCFVAFVALRWLALHYFGEKQGAGISQVTATGNRSEACDLSFMRNEDLFQKNVLDSCILIVHLKLVED